MDPTTAVYIAAASAVFYVLYRRFTSPSLSDLPGPVPESFLLGSLRELLQTQVGEADFKWQERYGNVVHFKTALGGDMLFISDPKALQYIFQTSGYNYQKLPERRALSRLHSGHGLVWADGETHKKQRKVMLPPFSGPESKALLPVFNRYAEMVTVKWKDDLSSSPDHSMVYNVPAWLSRATMDAIGEAAFDYHFNAMEDVDSDIVKGYNGLMNIVFGSPSAGKILVLDIARFIPRAVIEWLQDYLPGKGLQKARDSEALTSGVARTLIKSKSEALAEGRRGRDILSLLVKANKSENEKTRMDENEMISSMRTILFAGHETTSNTISWALLELSRNPNAQAQLRKEIREMESAIRARGDTEFSATDMDQMSYALAIIKETLRIHPVIHHTFRRAMKDDVLPLSEPIRTKSGKLISEIPIAKGTRVVLSIAGYNRNSELWGADVHSFRPERWLDGSIKKTQTIGVYNNLLTFAGGVRACIGWRFAVHEVQAFLVELISNFEFSLTEDIKRLRREPCGVMLPTLEGEVEKGVQMPLKVTLATQDE